MIELMIKRVRRNNIYLLDSTRIRW